MNRNAFTLVELLVVVAVIGALATVATFQFMDAIQRSDASACQVNLKTIHTALLSYRLDHNRFPPADGLADAQPQPNATSWGCGPAANGYWSGVPMLLAQEGYCSENALYCPALKRAYNHSIEAYPTCGNSSYAGKWIPQWRYLRFAYNNAATDVGFNQGGENNIEWEWNPDVWLLRCLHLDVGQFDPERNIRFPFRFPSAEKPNQVWYGEFELSIHGHIKERLAQRVR
ncbi:MAG: prepilin-type N-terminal cleavage/methylation domain-containing protein [Candidatus Omnitrophota bacterium]|jgi:prepilin-type N-terminal cleavage/methylation domain-containing protein|nr:MAG: prepilin-type N-terminal cleavage/methylation domain-containing protein [Candidatus Omnitrophota bacterium]